MLLLTLGVFQYSRCHTDVIWYRRCLLWLPCYGLIVPSFHQFFLQTLWLAGTLLLLMTLLKGINFSLGEAWILFLGPSMPQKNSWVLVPLISGSRFQSAEWSSLQSAHIKHLKGYRKLFFAGTALEIHGMLSTLSKGILTKEHIWSIYSPALLGFKMEDGLKFPRVFTISQLILKRQSDDYCSPASWSLLKSQDNSKVVFIHALQNDLESFPPFFYFLNSFYIVGIIFSLRTWYHLLLKHLCLFTFKR